MAASIASLPPAQAQEELQELLNGPALVPPAGVIPNFHNPHNLNNFVILTITLCLTFTTFAVGIRMYTKAFIIRNIALDDYAIIIAWLGEVGMTAPAILTVKHGGGTHRWDLQLKNFFRMLYYTDVWTIIYAPIIFFVKLSILLQYLKIFVPTRKANMVLFVMIQTCLWSCFVFYLVSTAFQIFMCHPRAAFWQPILTPGHCFNYYASYKASGIFNVVSDFTILMIPMFPLWKLNLSRGRKLSLVGIFGTGIFACATSILRTYYTWKITYTADTSYYTMPIGLWTDAEVATGILVCCLPVTPRFFQFVGPKISKTFSIGSKSGSSKSGKKTGPDDRTGRWKGLGYFRRNSIKHTLGLNSFPETWGVARSSSPNAQPDSNYVTLDDYSATAPLKIHRAAVTRPDDLETGQSGASD